MHKNIGGITFNNQDVMNFTLKFQLHSKKQNCYSQKKIFSEAADSLAGNTHSTTQTENPGSMQTTHQYSQYIKFNQRLRRI